MEKLRTWRNDPLLNGFLCKIDKISIRDQVKWWENNCIDDTVATFAIDEVGSLNRLVGSVAVYDIKGDTAEVGKILVGDPEAKGKK